MTTLRLLPPPATGHARGARLDRPARSTRTDGPARGTRADGPARGTRDDHVVRDARRDGLVPGARIGRRHAPPRPAARCAGSPA